MATAADAQAGAAEILQMLSNGVAGEGHLRIDGVERLDI
jgi:hypothetical protein